MLDVQHKIVSANEILEYCFEIVDDCNSIGEYYTPGWGIGMMDYCDVLPGCYQSFEFDITSGTCETDDGDDDSGDGPPECIRDCVDSNGNTLSDLFGNGDDEGPANMDGVCLWITRVSTALTVSIAPGSRE